MKCFQIEIKEEEIMSENLLSVALNGGVGLVGAVIGGSFTLYAARASSKRQKKQQFKEKYPVMMQNIDLIIEVLIKIKKSEKEYRYLFEYPYIASEDKKPKSDDPTFSYLMDTAVKVDGVVYKKVYQFRKNYMEQFNIAISIRDNGFAINDRILDNSINYRKQVDDLVYNIKNELNELLEFLQSYHKDMENEYFND